MEKEVILIGDKFLEMEVTTTQGKDHKTARPTCCHERVDSTLPNAKILQEEPNHYDKSIQNMN